MERREELEILRQVVAIERGALESLEARMDESFLRAVDLILETSGGTAERGGRLIVCGLGKSGFVARKIAATMTSTGTPAFFVHPIEGAHGDFGLIQPGDCALVISKSGAGDELTILLPFLKRRGVPVIAITHDLTSPLARHADILLDASIEQEACPNGVAPTTSSTLALVIGDALAVALMRRRGFTKEDFAFFHPAGALGRQLLLTVADALPAERGLPRVTPDTTLPEVIVSISGSRCGATAVIEDERLAGLITDGDLRRHMLQAGELRRLTARDLMTPRPKTIDGVRLAVEALRLLNQHKIQQLVVLDEGGRPAGILHLHDLLALGIR
ncbi:MAG: KpsF/GutQ family sugar-phosphate isomerase [bacterium]|jgi:arabinose-5-phosphate isomerase|nr:KpsF/GutQ family sugar-phosphate isomerase [bacterium]